jgi:hypothetical protein
LAVVFMMDDSQIRAPFAPFTARCQKHRVVQRTLAQVPQRGFVKVEGVRVET